VALYCSVSYCHSSRVSFKSCRYCSIVGYLAWVSSGVMLPSNKSVSTSVSETIIVSRPFSLSAVLRPPGTFGLGAMFQVNFTNLAGGLSVPCSW
jgi:hypothetical protein